MSRIDGAFALACLAAACGGRATNESPSRWLVDPPGIGQSQGGSTTSSLAGSAPASPDTWATLAGSGGNPPSAGAGGGGPFTAGSTGYAGVAGYKGVPPVTSIAPFADDDRSRACATAFMNPLAVGSRTAVCGSPKSAGLAWAGCWPIVAAKSVAATGGGDILVVGVGRLGQEITGLAPAVDTCSYLLGFDPVTRRHFGTNFGVYQVRDAGSYGSLEPFQLVADRAGNRWVAARYNEYIKIGNVEFATPQDFHKNVVIQFGPTGQVNWVHEFRKQLPMGYVPVLRIAVDADGNGYLSSDVVGTAALDDYELAPPAFAGLVVTKVDSTGSVLWVYRSKDLPGRPTAIDVRGNRLAIAGEGMFAKMLDTSGNLVWEHTYSTGSNNGIYGVAIDSKGGLIIGGYASMGVDFGGGKLEGHTAGEPVLAALDADGNHLWSRIYPRVGGDQAGIEDLSLDGADNIIVGGWSDGTLDFGAGPLLAASSAFGYPDGFVALLDPNGVALHSSLTKAAAEAIGCDGNLYRVVAVQNYSYTVELVPPPVLATAALRCRMIEEIAKGKILRSKQSCCRRRTCFSSFSRLESGPQYVGS